MANLVNHSVTNLINGVSQQATSVRLDNQLEEQINCVSDITKGLTIRNGLELKNVTQTNLGNRIPIEFNIDGTTYVLGMDMSDATQLIHVPLSADIDALSASVETTSYFDNITKETLRVVEDKDNVYLLNTEVTVGKTETQTAYYNISIANDSTGAANINWTTGDYDLTIQSVATTGTKVEADISFTIDSTWSRADIADYINAQPLVDEIGPVTIKGSTGGYRLYFNNIPVGFDTPTVTAVEGTPIYGYDTYLVFTPSSGWYGIYQGSGGQVQTNTLNGEYYRWEYQSYNNTTYLYWGNTQNTLIGTVSGNPTSLQIGAYTYYRGNVSKNFTTGSSTFNNWYSIRRSEEATATYTYTVSASAPVSGSGSEDSFSNSGMIWVTGVASNQEYSVELNYINSAGTPQTETASVNVGTTVSNIKLNYVASQLATQLSSSGVFNTTVYSNAIYIVSATDDTNEITSIDADNNFDISSISAAIRASTTNDSGITDTSNLPPIFEDGFKVRVGTTEGTTDSNYYLEYDAAFEGWKECSLDSNRALDNTTMPYIINKEKVRTTGEITVEEGSWELAKSGDSNSNPDPSFVDTTLNDVFFYGSRLGFATDATLVLSGIDDQRQFYRTTCSQLLTADRVDIQLDSSKIGFSPINNVTSHDSKLLVNTKATQSILLVNNAFDLTTARLAEVSSYSLGEFKPLPVNNGLYFGVSNNNRTNIYNYLTLSAGTYEAFNLTKHVPSYIEGNVTLMAYASDLTVVATDNDPKTLYVQNRYSVNGEMVQNAWHKWTVPYDVTYFTFVDNNLYVFMTAKNSSDQDRTLVCKYDISPQVVTSEDDDVYIGWIPYLDCYTKDKTLVEEFDDFIGINDEYGTLYDSVSEAYDSTQITQDTLGTVDGPHYSQVSPVYYWKVDGNTNSVVFNDGTEILTGNSSIEYFDYDGYRYYKGDETGDSGYYEVSRAEITQSTFSTNNVVYGLKFKASVVLSEIIPRLENQNGFTVMNYATLMLRRMRLFLDNTGVFEVNVDFKDRKDYTLTYTGRPLGKLVLGRASVSDINFKFPINGKSDRVTITISTDSSTPFNLLSAEWQGKLTVRGRNI